jgi:hypothetical protein|tara:strand:+ start:1280 stop:1396 length:117 start_codon:yes stop_codon:yes gene_type:complete
MPVYLRRWYLQKLSSTYEEEAKQLEKQQRAAKVPKFKK